MRPPRRRRTARAPRARRARARRGDLDAGRELREAARRRESVSAGILEERLSDTAASSSRIRNVTHHAPNRALARRAATAGGASTNWRAAAPRAPHAAGREGRAPAPRGPRARWACARPRPRRARRRRAALARLRPGRARALRARSMSAATAAGGAAAAWARPAAVGGGGWLARSPPRGVRARAARARARAHGLNGCSSRTSRRARTDGPWKRKDRPLPRRGHAPPRRPRRRRRRSRRRRRRRRRRARRRARARGARPAAKDARTNLALVHGFVTEGVRRLARAPPAARAGAAARTATCSGSRRRIPGRAAAALRVARLRAARGARLRANNTALFHLAHGLGHGLRRGRLARAKARRRLRARRRAVPTRARARRRRRRRARDGAELAARGAELGSMCLGGVLHSERTRIERAAYRRLAS